jgi:hypothetical protein
VLFLSAESLKKNSSPAIPKKPVASALPNVFTPGMLTGIAHALSHRSQTQKWRN